MMPEITEIAPVKLEKKTKSRKRFHKIPPNLAKLSLELVTIHKDNGTITWLFDMVGDAAKERAEPEPDNITPQDTIHPPTEGPQK